MRKHLLLGAMTAALALFMACDDGDGGLDAGAGAVNAAAGNYTIDIVWADDYGADAAYTYVSVENANKAWVPAATANYKQNVKLTVKTIAGGGG
jgi:hypothetical protein